MQLIPPYQARPSLARLNAGIERCAYLVLLALPAGLLYTRAGAEIGIGLICGLFLLHSFLVRDISWLWGSFPAVAGAWWVWQIICSTAGTGGLGLALVAFRLPLFAVALGHWLLSTEERRRFAWLALAISAAWICLEAWQQYLTGYNLFGHVRWGDGALTGPFNRPRAGPALILILFPVLLPMVARLFAAGRQGWVAGVLLAVLSTCTVLLIGQRMPSVLVVLGLVLTGLVLPRLRAAMVAVALAGALLLASMPIVAPAAYQKLIVHTTDQVRHFAASPYGEIWARAGVIAEQHKWLGLGVNGFRRGCADPASVQGLPFLGVTLQDAQRATDACNIHPHNYYLEATDNGGLPLLVLFVAMIVACMAPLAYGLRTRPDPRRAGIFVGLTLAFWPLATTSAFSAMPNAGWIFMLAGLGFAEAAARARPGPVAEVGAPRLSGFSASVPQPPR